MLYLAVGAVVMDLRRFLPIGRADATAFESFARRRQLLGPCFTHPLT
jgi:hypothetical protein